MNAARGEDGLEPGDPRRIGPFQVVGRLGGGGMGQVYRAVSPGGRAVAVKVIRPELAQDPHFRDRFAREAAAARRVNAFYTAPIVDADPDADPPWLATAYIDGPTLHEAITAEGPLRGPALRRLAAGLAEGLVAVHAAGLVHRDLKPGNVILADDGPRIIDFGIARPLDATTLTPHTAVLGTPMFMSPEQMLLERPGPASDLFALGGVLVFAATGRPPFGTGTFYELRDRILNDTPNLAGVPTSLMPLLIDCLAKASADRPSAADVLATLSTETPVAALGRQPPTTIETTSEVHQPPTARLAPTVAETRTSATGSATITGTIGTRIYEFGNISIAFMSALAALVGCIYSVVQTVNNQPLIFSVHDNYNAFQEIFAGTILFGLAGASIGALMAFLGAVVIKSDTVEIDAEKMLVTRYTDRVSEATVFTVAWDALERLTIQGEGNDAQLVAWFKPSRRPSPEWLARHRVVLAPDHKGYLLYPRLKDGKAVRARHLKAPLARYAPNLYQDRRRVQDP